ncbi:hypothetical protein Ocin01_03439 [Orchesella cincta]|uniref:Uncharacterized protein n=1 Tax=Orchesella cincta TaxID=48709 RepID=A0A1D2ND99_ORCCI|nr:hypothetical protein Ocin01_03439 [Orchesella cincta]
MRVTPSSEHLLYITLFLNFRWTFTVVKRNYPFKRSKDEPFFGNVISCASEDELHKWIGAMVIGEHPEGLNPIIM